MYKRLNHNLTNILLLFLLSSFWFLFSNVLFMIGPSSFNPTSMFLFLNLVFLVTAVLVIHKIIKDIIYYKESEPEFESETEFDAIKGMLLLFLVNIWVFGLTLSENKYFTIGIDLWNLIFSYYSFIVGILLCLIIVLLVVEILRNYANGTISKLETQVLSFNVTYYELLFLPMLYAFSIAFFIFGSFNLNSTNFDLTNAIFYILLPFAVMLLFSVVIMLYPTVKINSIFRFILYYPYSFSNSEEETDIEISNSGEGTDKEDTDLLDPEKVEMIESFFTKRNTEFILLVNILIWILFLLYLNVIFFF